MVPQISYHKHIINHLLCELMLESLGIILGVCAVSTLLLLPCYYTFLWRTVEWSVSNTFYNGIETFQEVIPNNGLLLRQQVIVCSQIQPIESNKRQERRGEKKEPVDVLKSETKPEHGSHWQDSAGPQSSAHEEQISGS